MPQTFLSSYRGEWFTVSTTEQARLLSDPAAVRHLEPFVGRSLGAAQAAHEAGASVEGMLYRVRQFLKAGLLTQVGELRRAGRTIRLYAAPGGLRLPFALTPFADLEAQLSRQTRPYDQLRTRAMARGLTRHGLGGRLIYRGEEGGVHSGVEMESHDTRRALMQQWRSDDFVGVMYLDDAQAAQAQRLLEELRDLLSVAGASDPAKHPYLIQTAMVRLMSEDLPG